MLSLLATLAAAALPACGPIDLDTAIALAGSRSDEMAIKRSEVAAAEADLALAKAARWFPEFNATITGGPSPEARAVEPDKIAPCTTAGTQGTCAPVAKTGSSQGLEGVLGVFGRVDVNVVQPLYTFGRLSAARDAAEAGVQARTLAVEDMLSQVELRVRRLFWGEALARKLIAIAADVDKALQDVEKRIQDLLKANDPSISLADRYKIEVYKGEIRGRQAEARKGLDLAHIGLAATLGASPDRLVVEKVALPVDLNGGEVPDRQAAREAAERRRPDLLGLDQAILAKKAQVETEEAAAKPQFFIAGFFTYSRANNRDIVSYPWAYDPLNAFGFGGAIGVRQDLAFHMLGARAHKARAELATLEAQRTGLARLVSTQVETAVSELRTAQERFTAARGSRDAGRALFVSTTLDFQVGLLEARSVLEAYTLYVQNQVSLAQAAYDLLVARAQFGQATGESPRRGTATCELY